MRDRNPRRRSTALANVIDSLRAVRPTVPGLAGLALVLGLLFGMTASYGAPVPQGVGPPPGGGTLDPKTLAESIRNYERLARERPHSAELWSNLGVVRAMAGNCADALPALERAESLNASLFNPWFFAGYCHFALHQSQQASASLERATRLNPRDANAWFLRAQVSSDLGNLEDSLRAVLRAESLGAARAESYYFAGRDALALATLLYGRVAGAKPTPDLYSLFLDAQRNAALGELEPAIDQYQRALKVAPDRPDIHFALGTADLEKGQYTEAAASFRRCLELAPSSGWTRLRLGLALLKLSKPDEALSLFRAASIDGLQSPSEYWDFLSCAYLLGLADVARTALARAQQRFRYDGWSAWTTRLAPHSEDLRSNPTSLKLEALTGVGLSLRFWLTAKDVKGNDFAALFPTLAAYRSFQDDFLHDRWMQATEKIAPLLRADLQPDTPARAFALGQILQALAYGLNLQLASEFPDSTAAMKLAADNLVAMGQPKKALEIYHGMAQRDGPSPDILREMARIYWMDHRWNQALEALEPLAKMDPYDATVFVNLGRIYAYQQKSDRAAEAFRRAIQIEPRRIEAHAGLGQLLRSQGDFESALRELKTASRIDPSNPKLHYELSQVYRKLGEQRLALEEMASFEQFAAAASSEARQQDGALVPLD
jgi:tetratricopeptide (TPR) repeat protein